MNNMKKSIISATIRFQSGGIENSCHSIAGGCWSFLCSVAAGAGAAAGSGGVFHADAGEAAGGGGALGAARGGRAAGLGQHDAHQ